jgi:hypothetical protein
MIDHGEYRHIATLMIKSIKMTLNESGVKHRLVPLEHLLDVLNVFASGCRAVLTEDATSISILIEDYPSTAGERSPNDVDSKVEPHAGQS